MGVYLLAEAARVDERMQVETMIDEVTRRLADVLDVETLVAFREDDADGKLRFRNLKIKIVFRNRYARGRGRRWLIDYPVLQ